MANQLEMVNGELQEMSDADQAEYDARQAEWPAIAAAQQAQTALPDIHTQVATLTAALISKGTLLVTDLPSTQVIAANQILDAAKQPIIK